MAEKVQSPAAQDGEMTQEELREILKIRRDKLANLQQEGRDPFQQVRFDRTHHTRDILERFEQMEGATVRLAGRLMSKRVMGKASFTDLSDRYGPDSAVRAPR